MCTVTFTPTNSSYIFTSSRDEKYTRNKIEFPTYQEVGGHSILFPRDCEAKGTWIAISVHRTVCLLNGAFVYHESTPPYRKSRGLMVLESFQFDTIKSFVEEYDFSGIEPFTFIMIDNSKQEGLNELRWDGEKVHHARLSMEEKCIWSSATLYTKEAQLNREEWFSNWHQKHATNLQNCRAFHYDAGKESKDNSVLLKREEKGTVSITSVVPSKEGVKLIIDDFTETREAVLSNEVQAI